MLKLEQVSKQYGEKRIFQAVNLILNKNEIVSIIGPSGVGKTTLLRIIAGLTGYEIGNVCGNDKPMSYVFQEDRLLPWLSAEDNIRIVNDALTELEFLDLLELSKLKDARNLMPDEMSGGMRQRVSLARAFAFKHEMILMDEPFKSIDEYLKNQLILDVLNLWRANPKSILMVTHDLDEALMMSDTIYFMGGSPATLKKVMQIDTPRAMTLAQIEEAKNNVRQFWEEIDL